MGIIDLGAYTVRCNNCFQGIYTAGGNYRIIDDVAGPKLYVPSGTLKL